MTATETILFVLERFGVATAMLGVTLYALYLKDKALTLEQQARIADAKAHNAVAMALQERVIANITTLGQLADQLEKAQERRR